LVEVEIEETIEKEIDELVFEIKHVKIYL